MQPISPHGAGVRSCQLSAFSPLEAGVPQGSILGPLLFLIYINDLPRYMEGEETVLFADDSTISQKIKNLPECGTYFSSSHNKIEHWFSANHLYLNNDKTEEVIFSLRDMGNFNNPEFVTFLGVKLQPNLSGFFIFLRKITERRTAMTTTNQKGLLS
ncbi:hypothetical protein M8J75_002650 [Diaphorina citri]|nr:hypothetical protein M8J75_002650 [Diaphorina citri]